MAFDEMHEGAVPLVDAGLNVIRQPFLRAKDRPTPSG